MHIDSESQTTSIFLNCKQSRINKTLKNTIPADEVELSISQNALEFMFPYDMRLEVSEFVREVMNFDVATNGVIENMGITNVTGFLKATNDPKILDQLDHSQL